jgi:hypothetical protein
VTQITAKQSMGRGEGLISEGRGVGVVTQITGKQSMTRGGGGKGEGRGDSQSIGSSGLLPTNTVASNKSKVVSLCNHESKVASLCNHESKEVGSTI